MADSPWKQYIYQESTLSQQLDALMQIVFKDEPISQQLAFTITYNTPDP